MQLRLIVISQWEQHNTPLFKLHLEAGLTVFSVQCEYHLNNIGLKVFQDDSSATNLFKICLTKNKFNAIVQIASWNAIFHLKNIQGWHNGTQHEINELFNWSFLQLVIFMLWKWSPQVKCHFCAQLTRFEIDFIWINMESLSANMKCQYALCLFQSMAHFCKINTLWGKMKGSSMFAPSLCYCLF